MTGLVAVPCAVILLAITVGCSRQGANSSSDRGVGHASADSSAPKSERDTTLVGFVDGRKEIAPTPEELTELTFRILHGEIEKLRGLNGALPEELGEILKRREDDPSLRPQADWLEDGWGTPIRYVRNGDRYKLVSSGPDRRFGTADDQESRP